MCGIPLQVLGLTVGAMLISACASSAQDGADGVASVAAHGEGDEVFVAETEVVAQLDVAGVDVSFLRVTDPNGAQRIVLYEVSPMTLTVSPLRDLAMAQGLTALEVFLSLSPPDAHGPAALEAAHELQARALGREDASSVIQARFELPSVIEKSSATCDDWVFTTMGNDFSVTNKKRLEDHTGIGRLYTDWTISATTVGSCNESTTETGDHTAYYIFQPPQADLRRAIEQEGLNARGVSWVRYGTISALPPGTRGRWYNFAYHPPEVCDGFDCTVAPTMYAVEATLLPPHRFRLRTAHVSVNPH